ncbi:hypothetical protein Syun_030119 [Stephania yunnanensis]|uniref:Uncharacterized protein n=1 Tax=Stephania yunnanensis TaxID=152371 RepID=A0AAP0E997_9MAGN
MSCLLQQWNGGPPNLYDISGSAHFINKCDNGIVIHRNRDLEIRPLDQVQVCVHKVRNKVVGTIGDAFLSYNRFAILAFYSSFVWDLCRAKLLMVSLQVTILRFMKEGLKCPSHGLLVRTLAEQRRRRLAATRRPWTRWRGCEDDDEQRRGPPGRVTTTTTTTSVASGHRSGSGHSS